MNENQIETITEARDALKAGDAGEAERLLEGVLAELPADASSETEQATPEELRRATLDADFRRRFPL